MGKRDSENEISECHHVPLLSNGDPLADFEQRIIYLIGDINEEAAGRFLISFFKMDSASNDPIKVVVYSHGGIENSGYAIYDSIITSKSPVLMEGYGLVASIAAAIFQAGDYRILSPQCDFLVHNGSVVMNEAKQDTVLELAKQIKVSNKRYHHILFKNSKLSMEDIEILCQDDRILSAEEAIKMGFADEIIKPIKKFSKRKRKKQ